MDEEKRYDIVEMEARMYAPLEWDSPAICKIQDLKEAHYDEALRLIKHHFFREEPMCKTIALLQDETSVKTYLDLIRIWMKDTTSLVALSLTSGRVIGVAVTRINSNSEKSDIYNRVLNFEGDALEKIMGLINALIKRSNVYEEFDCDIYLRIHVLCVHPSYQQKGVATALLKVCIQVASKLDISAVGVVFTSGLSQSLALKLGFRLIAEIRYSRWVVEDRVVFDDTGKGNYSVAFMGIQTPRE
ncbi:hypothetical protein ALC56_04955 [Trachymyrmex septentrionalis]|uniref:aralkylamine N-acetyltransferase n=1 Tax=Trachymyrmex septentrionalis TaxID=34720 RepID=A0A195FJW1_9HYME|nr:PREDICTED: uncharacterized protein LOC108747392 [Trachymyrmex septentrionalis]KYN40646.1 hypothetical protein ALC56_04955 [Trachymyrmex septentrionalis]